MKLMLFLGAGVSVPSKLPTALELTDELFDPLHAPTEELNRVQAFLRLIRDHDTADIPRAGPFPTDGGYKASGAVLRGDRSTYEDIFFLCQQIDNWSSALTDNSQTTAFLENIERKAGSFLNSTTFEARMFDLGRFGGRACRFIESVVAKRLRRDYLKGFDLLLALATTPDLEELNIVTLNHDTLVEQFLSAHGVAFADGFSEPDGDVRWYDDTTYDRQPARVRVIKLHGSVNWYAFSHSGKRRSAVFLGTDLASVRDGAGRRLVPEISTPSFLSGMNKAIQYHRGIYADVHFRFLDLLRRSERVLMSGYGWGDTAISFQFEAWLDRALGNRLMLLHRNPTELTDRSLILRHTYNNRIRDGQLIVLERWLSETSMADLKRLLT